jgi:hypothetical protein
MNPSPQFMDALHLYDRLAQTHGDQPPKSPSRIDACVRLGTY